LLVNLLATQTVSKKHMLISKAGAPKKDTIGVEFFGDHTVYVCICVVGRRVNGSHTHRAWIKPSNCTAWKDHKPTIDKKVKDAYDEVLLADMCACVWPTVV